MVKKVGFFIVGAPKCGTTSLAKYLEEHDQVFFSKNKEPYFFCNDFPLWRFEKHIRDYHKNNFNNFNNESCAYGEGSTWYMYSDVAIKNIREYNNDSKIIVMLRNPAEMLHSLFEFRKYGGTEYNKSFEEVWGYNSERKKGNKIPFQWRVESKLLFYDELAKFGDQLENILNYFPQGNVKVIFFDDFIVETASVYKDVLEFLGVQYDNRISFEVFNEGKSNVRFRFVRVGFKSLFRIIPYTLYEKIKSYLNLGSLEPLLMKYGFVGQGKSSVLSKDLRVKIISKYLDDIHKLEDLTGRDLSKWYDI